MVAEKIHLLRDLWIPNVTLLSLLSCAPWEGGGLGLTPLTGILHSNWCLYAICHPEMSWNLGNRNDVIRHTHLQRLLLICMLCFIRRGSPDRFVRRMVIPLINSPPPLGSQVEISLTI